MSDLTITLRQVSGYGWLATIENAGEELYRGEFHISSFDALEAAHYWMDARGGEYAAY